MRRVIVAGCAGAGKTTFARALAGRAGLPFHELDELYLMAGWQIRPSFVADVDAITAGEAWVFDSWGYPEVRDLLWERADTLVWLDYPRRVVMPRVIRRSAWRTLTRKRVFGGNRERLVDWLADHPVRSAWSGHAARRAAIGARAADPRFAGLRVVRHGDPASAAAWLRTVAGPGSD